MKASENILKLSIFDHTNYRYFERIPAVPVISNNPGLIVYAVQTYLNSHKSLGWCMKGSEKHKISMNHKANKPASVSWVVIAQETSKGSDKPVQGFSYLSEAGARGRLYLGKKHLDHQSWDNLMQSKRT